MKFSIRILGFRRAIPITGRILNMTSELAALAELRVAVSMYISPLNNICYPGYCVKYCSFFYAVCGHPHTVESSFAAFLPTHELAQRKVNLICWLFEVSAINNHFFLRHGAILGKDHMMYEKKLYGK